MELKKFLTLSDGIQERGKCNHLALVGKGQIMVILCRKKLKPHPRSGDWGKKLIYRLVNT